MAKRVRDCPINQELVIYFSQDNTICCEECERNYHLVGAHKVIYKGCFRRYSLEFGGYVHFEYYHHKEPVVCPHCSSTATEWCFAYVEGQKPNVLFVFLIDGEELAIV